MKYGLNCPKNIYSVHKLYIAQLLFCKKIIIVAKYYAYLFIKMSNL